MTEITSNTELLTQKYSESKDKLLSEHKTLNKELEKSKKRKSVLKSIGVENVTQEIAIELLSLPKKLGTHPETNEDVLADFLADLLRLIPWQTCSGRFLGRLAPGDNLGIVFGARGVFWVSFLELRVLFWVYFWRP